ncbi:hypothetical protein ACS0TY_020315 [Phlomoides rotata]
MDNAPLIDVTHFRYFKVLGKGLLPAVVKEKLISKNIEKNNKEVGGVVAIAFSDSKKGEMNKKLGRFSSYMPHGEDFDGEY